LQEVTYGTRRHRPGRRTGDPTFVSIHAGRDGRHEAAGIDVVGKKISTPKGALMYIGLGTIVLIVIIVLVVLMLRRR
jgi:hypothetical protein